MIVKSFTSLVVKFYAWLTIKLREVWIYIRVWLSHRLHRPQKTPLGSGRSIRPLIPSKPVHLETRYQLMADDHEVDGVFLRVRDHVFRQISGLQQPQVRGQQLGKRIFREAGRLGADRRYFFLQPLNEDGFLFERNAHGWTVSRAQKIVERATFMRRYEPWDVVKVYKNEDQRESRVRLSSERFGLKLVSPLVYEQKLIDYFKEQA